MRLLSRYITGSFFVTFGGALAVLTFVMSIAALFRISDLLAFGATWSAIARIFLTGVPQAIAFSIPVSVLVAALLVFGRLSADGEITAMKSSGISMQQILRWPAAFAIALSAVCLYLQADVVPRCEHARRQALWALGVETPIKMIEPGRFMRELPGLAFYVGWKKDTHIRDVIIYQQLSAHRQRSILAESGTLRIDPSDGALYAQLYRVQVDPVAEDRPGRGYFAEFHLRIELPRRNDQSPKKKVDLTLAELAAAIRNPDSLPPTPDPQPVARRQMLLLVEAAKRIVLSLSCLAFAVLGVPLGLRTSRRESSIGIAMSLLLVFVFYLFIIVGESLAKYPAVYPQAIVCLPLVLAMGLGGYLIRRSE